MNIIEKMSEKIVIRPVKSRDSNRIASICRQLGYPISHEQALERILEVEQSETNRIFVAEYPSDLIVGWIQVCIRLLIVAGLLAEIEGLVVDQAFRRSGVGRTLMLESEAWSSAQGCTAIYLRSNVLREGARPFYESIGYVVLKEQWVFHRI